MGSFDINNLEKLARQRKMLRQIKVIKNEMCSSATISRIENGKQVPGEEKLEMMLNFIGFPADEFFCPYLFNPSIKALNIYDEMSNVLDVDRSKATISEANNLLARIRLMNEFKKGVNRQYYLSCKARIMEMEDENTDEIFPYIYEGIHITFPEFDSNTYNGEMLIFEEPELLLTLSRLYHKNGDTVKAIKFLENINKSINVLPEDDR